jgi:hypothetical protein
MPQRKHHGGITQAAIHITVTPVSPGTTTNGQWWNVDSLFMPC